MKRQVGATIVSIMIGLLISTVGILASLTLYKTLVGVASNAKADALHDGQIATTLLGIQLRVQNAGFGLAPSPNHIAVNEVLNEKKLMWRYRVDGQLRCEGIKRYIKTVGGVNHLAIDFIEASNLVCSDVLDLQSLPWSSVSTLSVFRDDITSLVDFSVDTQNCSPYGMDVPGSYRVLTLTGKAAAVVAGAKINGQDVPDTVLRLCLSNIQGA